MPDKAEAQQHFGFRSEAGKLCMWHRPLACNLVEQIDEQDVEMLGRGAFDINDVQPRS